MMNYIWVFFILFSFISAILTGNTQQLSNGILSSGSAAVTLVISLLGAFVFWSGLMNICEKSGLTSVISNMLSPVLNKLFPNSGKETKKAISMNITANLLGIGNAATPLGIEAMKRLSQEDHQSSVANNSMVLFVVMNTAAMRIIPTTVAYLRQEYGSKSPMEIFIPAILTSACALSVGIISVKLAERIKNVK